MKSLNLYRFFFIFFIFLFIFFPQPFGPNSVMLARRVMPLLAGPIRKAKPVLQIRIRSA